MQREVLIYFRSLTSKEIGHIAPLCVINNFISDHTCTSPSFLLMS